MMPKEDVDSYQFFWNACFVSKVIIEVPSPTINYIIQEKKNVINGVPVIQIFQTKSSQMVVFVSGTHFME